eukprot:TCALIF_08918-PA protein Name:"Protein of unknown function" AED:0.36 eAED:0.38 QI:0/0/0/0.2/0.75/0.4/5/0/623
MQPKDLQAFTFETDVQPRNEVVNSNEMEVKRDSSTTLASRSALADGGSHGGNHGGRHGGNQNGLGQYGNGGLFSNGFQSEDASFGNTYSAQNVQPSYANNNQGSFGNDQAVYGGGAGGDDNIAMLEKAVPGTPGEDYPIYAEVPETAFICDGQVDGGYYADPEAECQVFHICSNDGLGGLTKNSFLCPNGTIFNQEYFICDWWFNFDCGEAEGLYSLNDDIAAEREAASQNNQATYQSAASAPQASYASANGAASQYSGPSNNNNNGRGRQPANNGYSAPSNAGNARRPASNVGRRQPSSNGYSAPAPAQRPAPSRANRRPAQSRRPAAQNYGSPSGSNGAAASNQYSAMVPLMELPVNMALPPPSMVLLANMVLPPPLMVLPVNMVLPPPLMVLPVNMALLPLPMVLQANMVPLLLMMEPPINMEPPLIMELQINMVLLLMVLLINMALPLDPNRLVTLMVPLLVKVLPTVMALLTLEAVLPRLMDTQLPPMEDVTAVNDEVTMETPVEMEAVVAMVVNVNVPTPLMEHPLLTATDPLLLKPPPLVLIPTMVPLPLRIRPQTMELPLRPPLATVPLVAVRELVTRTVLQLSSPLPSIKITPLELAPAMVLLLAIFPATLASK